MKVKNAWSLVLPLALHLEATVLITGINKLVPIPTSRRAELDANVALDNVHMGGGVYRYLINAVFRDLFCIFLR
jgi:hypothetical protein